MNNIRDLYGIIKSIETICEYITSVKEEWKENTKVYNMVSDLEFCFKTVNTELYNIDIISKSKALEMSREILKKNVVDINVYILEIKKWINIVSDTVNYRLKLNNKIDLEFYKYMDYIEMVSKDEIVRNGVNYFKAYKEFSEDDYCSMCDFYNKYDYFWGKVDIENNILDLFEKKAQALKENISEYIWLYNQLCDYRSKLVLTEILKFWGSFNIAQKNSIIENNFKDYYDFDLIKCDENEVFVDIGAYTGDSAKDFIESYINYKKIYCYEVTKDSIEKLNENLKEYNNINIINKAVGAQKGKMYIKPGISDTSGNRIEENGQIPIDMVTIDEDIKEKITFIKMDIEGSEKDALLGCKNHIINDKPKLAICTYHNNEDIWKIPKMMKEFNPNYKLYMRYNGSVNGFTTSEFVTFAIDN